MFQISQKSRKVYGRPKTRNPFPSHHSYSNKYEPRTPLFCFDSMIPPQIWQYKNKFSDSDLSRFNNKSMKDMITKNRDSSTNIYCNNEKNINKAINCLKFIKSNKFQDQEKNTLKFNNQTKVKINKHHIHSVNKKDKNDLYEFTFYNPKKIDFSKTNKHTEEISFNYGSDLRHPIKLKLQITTP